MKVNRRSFLAAAVAGVSSASGVARRALADAPPFVSNDVGALLSVVVHTPGAEGRRGLGLGGGANSIGNVPLSEEAASIAPLSRRCAAPGRRSSRSARRSTRPATSRAAGAL